MAVKTSTRRLLWGYVAVSAVVAAAVWAADRYAAWGFEQLARRHLELSSPDWLWLTAAVPLLWFTALHGLTDLPLWQRIFSAAIRSCVLALLAVVLSEPVLRSEDDVPVAVGVVVDVSDSMTDEALERAQGAVDRLWAEKGDVEVRIVATAGTAVVLPDAPDGRAPRVTRPTGGGRSTDLQAGLQLARSLLSPGAVPRLLLATDGRATQGSLADEVAVASRAGIPLFYLELSDMVAPGELWVRRVALPEQIKPRVPFSADVGIESTRPGAAVCSMDLDGEQVASQDVVLAGGRQDVRFDALRIPKGGEHRLRAACATTTGTPDRFEANNAVETVVLVPEKPKVLYVEGAPREAADFAQALSGELDVDVRGPGGLPGSAGALQAFDAVVVSDVPRQQGRRDNLSDAHMRAIREYVDRGGVFLFAGGPNGFGPGGYTDTYLERHVLPVDLDVDKQRETPSVALALVIDKSGSMSGEKIEMAKDAAKATATALQPSDLITVIAFDARPEVILPLGKAANRIYILNNLSRVGSGGGTEIRPALEQAYRLLGRAEAQTKHVILLTDGNSTGGGEVPLAERMFRERITVSTVAVGDGADVVLLQRIASAAGGNAYRTQDPSQIKKIFLSETNQLTRQAIVEERFTPRVAGRWGRLQAFRGVGWLPLRGYVSTRAKSGADVLMTTHRGEPLLARQRIGLGWSLAWTSDLKSRWAREWVGSGGYARFWRQLLRSSMPVDQETLYDVRVDVERGQLRVSADAVDDRDQFVNALAASAHVTAPDGAKLDVALAQTASGRYEAVIPIDPERGWGVWDVRAEFRAPELEEPIATGRGIGLAPYPDEIALSGRPDMGALEGAARQTGGKANPTPEELLAPSGRRLPRREPALGDLLLWALGLFVLDVALRRIRLGPAREVAWS